MLERTCMWAICRLAKIRGFGTFDKGRPLIRSPNTQVLNTINTNKHSKARLNVSV
jgi:hypothetical protein